MEMAGGKKADNRIGDLLTKKDEPPLSKKPEKPIFLRTSPPSQKPQAPAQARPASLAPANASKTVKDAVAQLEASRISEAGRAVIAGFLSSQRAHDDDWTRLVSNAVRISESAGPDCVQGYSEALAQTKDMGDATLALMNQKLLGVGDFVKAIGKTKAASYFTVIGVTKAVGQLTDPRVLAASRFVSVLSDKVAMNYFAAISASGDIGPLLDQKNLDSMGFVYALSESAKAAMLFVKKQG